MIKFDLKAYNSVQLCMLNSVEYLVLNKATCLQVPKKISFFFEKNSVKAEYHSALDCTMWQNLLKKQGVPYAQRLTLRGLGERTYEQKVAGVLSLKLGYSHKVNIDYNVKKIKIKTSKKKLVAASESKAHLGNFLRVVQKWKMPNSYVRVKKSGVWRRNQKKRMKLVKKK